MSEKNEGWLPEVIIFAGSNGSGGLRGRTRMNFERIKTLKAARENRRNHHPHMPPLILLTRNTAKSKIIGNCSEPQDSGQFAQGYHDERRREE